MSLLESSTIAAISTPRGTGGVAIIRVSGPESWSIVRSLVQSQELWSPGRVSHDWLLDPEDRELVDEVLILPFKRPKSFTGEDVVEIHCHGGVYLSKAVLNLCLKAGAEPAAEGEFTRRALMNGRLDLTQAESILDLIHAQGETLVKLSAHNLHHRAVGQLLEDYVARISTVQADLTASIDFPDEVEEPDRSELVMVLNTLMSQLQERIRIQQKNQVVREGIEVALIGLPNAGKSSLFNALLAMDRSIVTEVPGTTRDVIRETLQVKGVPVTLVDTAGLRETTDRVEGLGVERSWQAVGSAQAVMVVIDGTLGVTAADRTFLDQIEGTPGVLVWNKTDQATTVHPASGMLSVDWPWVSVSALSGEGLSAVMDWLDRLTETLTDRSQLDFLLSHRQLDHLRVVQSELSDAVHVLQDQFLPLDLATVPLTNALLELQGVLGHDTTEQVLDSVFSRFCVGK